MINNIKTFIFDMGGVLPGHTMNEYVLSVAKNDLEKKLFLDLVHSPTWIEMDRGLLVEEAYKIFCEEYDHKYDDEIKNFLNNFRQVNDPNPEMEELIIDLKNKGYNLFLMSNVSFMYKKFFPYIKSISYMDDLWVSCERGLIKPDKDAFLDLFSKFNLNPKECFFIDDSQKNIIAAKECGMDGFVYRGNVKELRENLGL